MATREEQMHFENLQKQVRDQMAVIVGLTAALIATPGAAAIDRAKASKVIDDQRLSLGGWEGSDKKARETVDIIWRLAQPG